MSNKDQVYQYPEEEYIDQSTLDVESEELDNSGETADSNSIGSMFEKVKSRMNLNALGQLSPKLKRSVFIVLLLVIIAWVIVPIYHKVKDGNGSKTLSAKVNKSSNPSAIVSSINSKPAESFSLSKEILVKSDKKYNDLSGQMNNLKVGVNRLAEISQKDIKSQAATQAVMLQLMEKIEKNQRALLDSNQKQTVKKLSKSASKDLILAVKNQIKKPESFKVQGIVPGLAWLVDTEGRTRTVRIGDDIDSYGKVSVIDTTKGLVETDTGKVFHQLG